MMNIYESTVQWVWAEADIEWITFCKAKTGVTSKVIITIKEWKSTILHTSLVK